MKTPTLRIWSYYERSLAPNCIRRIPIYSCAFLEVVELRADLHAAADDPRPVGETDIFFNRYDRIVEVLSDGI